MTKMFRILSAILAGTVIYVLVSLGFGRDGLWADGQLREQKVLLNTRTDEIQKINNSLELECTALKKDPDVIAAFARKLGYIRGDEKVVKITGFPRDKQFAFETGIPLKCDDPVTLPEWFCKVVGFIIFFIVYSCLHLEELKRRVSNFKEKR